MKLIPRILRTVIITLAILAVSTASTVPLATQSSNTVYVCTGGYAKSYHAKKNCIGLGNCKGEIKAVTKEEAVKAGRSPCRVCKP